MNESVDITPRDQNYQSHLNSVIKNSQNKDPIELKLFLEEQKRERLNQTMDLIKDLERYQPYRIKQMYNYKLTGMMEEE